MKKNLSIWSAALVILALSVGSCKKDSSSPTPTPTPTPETHLASNTQQKRMVVIEDFTGVRCGYCPDGHIRAKAYSDANPGKVIIIATHAGGYANPATGWADYTTAFGQALNDQSKLTGYPAGTVNRHVFSASSLNTPPYYQMSTGGMALGRGGWAQGGDDIKALDAPVNVGLDTKWDASTRKLTITTETYYMSDENEENDLNVAITQDGIVGKQEDYTLPSPYINNTYTQNNMLRDMVTGQWGEKVATTTKGVYTKKTYTYTVPDNYKGIPVDVNNLNVVAYVTRGHIEILNAAKVKAVK